VSIAVRAVSGALWSISTSVGARVIGLVGTLVLTRFLSEAQFGEVAVAQVVVLTVSMFTGLGLGQYIVAHPKAARATIFHASALYIGIGLVTLLAAVALRVPLGAWLGAPGMREFLPGLAVSVALERLAFMPERVLVREMRFRVVSIERSLGELAYTAGTVGFAAAGWGGMSVVMGSLARGVLRAAICLWVVPRRDWAEVHPFRMTTWREVLGFGLPLSVGNWAGFAAQQWDNLLMARLFGPGVLGHYKLAYNLADIPATHVGEQIGDVLLPSFGKMAPKDRRGALARAMSLIGLVVYPLALGLGAVSDTVVATLLDPRWRGVAPMLTLLSALSVARPVGWIVASYLQSQHRARAIMVLEIFKVSAILLGMLGLGQLGPLWACTAVGVGFGAHALASVFLVRRYDAIPARSLLLPLLPPFVACIPMVGAVLGVRWAQATLGVTAPTVRLAAELLTGAVVYVPSAFLFAPGPAQELLGLIRRVLKRRRQRGNRPSTPPPSSMPRADDTPPVPGSGAMAPTGSASESAADPVSVAVRAEVETAAPEPAAPEPAADPAATVSEPPPASDGDTPKPR
jgi:PST family polysaccharide transporter